MGVAFPEIHQATETTSTKEEDPTNSSVLYAKTNILEKLTQLHLGINSSIICQGNFKYMRALLKAH